MVLCTFVTEIWNTKLQRLSSLLIPNHLFLFLLTHTSFLWRIASYMWDWELQLVIDTAKLFAFSHLRAWMYLSANYISGWFCNLHLHRYKIIRFYPQEGHNYLSQQAAVCRVPITKVFAGNWDWYSNDKAGQGTEHFFCVDAVMP